MLDPWLATEKVLHHLAEVQGVPGPKEERYYAWHPLPLQEWYAGMTLAQKYLIDRNRCWTGEESFLDVGSGYGIKLALAEALGWRPFGIERYQPYASVSTRLFPNIDVQVVNAFEYESYDKFDLVYSYRLCIDLDDQRQLTSHIVSRMKPGALFFFAGGPDPVGLTRVGDSVWAV